MFARSLLVYTCLQLTRRCSRCTVTTAHVKSVPSDAPVATLKPIVASQLARGLHHTRGPA
jgi:hypothetical protein